MRKFCSNIFTRHTPGKIAIKSLSAISLLLATSLSTLAFADPSKEAEQAARRQDAAGAISILEQAAAKGDLTAKATLASYLRGFPPPYRNIERACALARETADAGVPLGEVTRAECLISGGEKAEQPIELARELARKAWKSGYGPGGYVLYLVYSHDPEFSYYQKGVPVQAKYNELAALPVSARAIQIEAFEGLASAARAGHVNSIVLILSYLADSTAPGNLDRILGAGGILQKVGEPIPPKLLSILNTTIEVKKLGNSHASPTAFLNTLKTAVVVATPQFQSGKAVDCNSKDIKLIKISSEPVKSAEYLPLPQPLANTYLIKGAWEEIWTFAGCQKELPLRITFNADGWSGVKFNVVRNFKNDQ